MRDNLHLFHPEAFDIIVVDESHHSKAPTHEKVVIHFTPYFILAITATSDRMDGLDIRELYGEPVYSLPFVDALCRKKLCPIDYRIMTDEIGSLKKIQTQKGRLSINHLNRTVFVPKRDEEIVKIIKSNMAEIENPCVKIYVESTDYAELLAEMLPGSIPIHNKVPKAERKIRLALFRQGVFKILISVDMFNESLDVPQINMEVFLRATDSLTVFYQQLMRGCRLHPSKKVLRVLDFVANCDRIIQVYELWSKIKTQTSFQSSSMVDPFTFDQGGTKLGLPSQNGVKPLFGINPQTASSKKKDSVDPFVLNVDSVEFREKIIPLIETIMQVRAEFYSNWQEASESVKKLGITNSFEYAERHREDARLPSGPTVYYEDFPGWPIFTGNPNIRRIRIYSTWEGASEIVKRLGIENSSMYREKYLEDMLLPYSPEKSYNDFPGWTIFTGNNANKRPAGQCYKTWQEASEAAKTLGVKNSTEYEDAYLVDQKLPRSPATMYEDFPGWTIFTGNLNNPRLSDECYPTWEEASEAAMKLGIKNWAEYKVRYREDLKLPSNPNQMYENFPGYLTFLNKPLAGQKFYGSWEEASKAAVKLGIKTFDEYQERYKEDERLPSSPHSYYENFPTIRIFLELKYETWQEASTVAISLGIKNRRDYEKRYKEDLKLPGNPRNYEGFPGWNTFFGKPISKTKK